MTQRDPIGELLIEELLSNPSKFNEQGRAYELLQQYFEGFSLKTLRPLLANNDSLVKRAAVWIVSELGKDGCDLLHNVIPLVSFEDRYIKYHALEIVMVCSIAGNTKEFIHVVRSLHDNDSVIRLLTMRLISRADELQMEEAIRQFRNDEPYAEIHKYGLTVLLEMGAIDKETIITMINDNRPLAKKYGAIAAKRIFNKYPDLIRYAASSEDSEIKAFSEDFIESESQL